MINGLYIINANTFWFMCYKVIGNIYGAQNETYIED